MTYQEFYTLVSRLETNTALVIYARQDQREKDMEVAQHNVDETRRQLLAFAGSRELK